MLLSQLGKRSCGEAARGQETTSGSCSCVDGKRDSPLPSPGSRAAGTPGHRRFWWHSVRVRAQQRQPAVTGALHSFTMTLSFQTLRVQNSHALQDVVTPHKCAAFASRWWLRPGERRWSELRMLLYKVQVIFREEGRRRESERRRKRLRKLPLLGSRLCSESSSQETGPCLADLPGDGRGCSQRGLRVLCLSPS